MHDLQKALKDIKEVFSFNLSIYENMLDIDRKSYPCLEAKTAQKTVKQLFVGMKTVDYATKCLEKASSTAASRF